VIVLGIDPGSGLTGFGVIEARRDRLRLVEAGTVRAPAGAELAERLRVLGDGLEALLDRCEPDSVAMEGIFTGRNARSALTIAHVRGAYLLLLARRRLPVAEYAPATVKRAVTGHGTAAKEQVRGMVGRLLHAPAGPGLALDASDALAVAICHFHTTGSGAHPVARAR